MNVYVFASASVWFRGKIDSYRAGGGRGQQPPLPLSEFVNFFGQNAHNSGNSTWEKTKKTPKKRDETAIVVPKRQAVKCETRDLIG